MKYFLTIIIITTTFLSHAQEASVEKKLYGLQTGILGVWVQRESKLTNTLALRIEVGLQPILWGGSIYDKTGFILYPVLTAEPRIYYNLDRRVYKAKRIENNSGNFLSLKITHQPDWFVISNYENISLNSDISIIPTWGIRRHIGKRINYEAGIGYGYRYSFLKDAGYSENYGETVLNLHLRIGYTF